MKNLPQFNILLLDASEALAASDAFNVDSASQDSATEFARLNKECERAAVELIEFCLLHGEGLLVEVKKESP